MAGQESSGTREGCYFLTFFFGFGLRGKSVARTMIVRGVDFFLGIETFYRFLAKTDRATRTGLVSFFH